VIALYAVELEIVEYVMEWEKSSSKFNDIPIMKITYCAVCHKWLHKEDKFCPACGAALERQDIPVRKTLWLSKSENLIVAIAFLPFIARIIVSFVEVCMRCYFHLLKIPFNYADCSYIVHNAYGIIMYFTPLLLAFAVQNKTTKRILLVIGTFLMGIKIWSFFV
jgi:hypothetical protein